MSKKASGGADLGVSHEGPKHVMTSLQSHKGLVNTQIQDFEIFVHFQLTNLVPNL